MTNHSLIRQAEQAAITIDVQLNLLIDAYDFYIERFPAETESEQLELKDLQVSIKALSELPISVALQLAAWKRGENPTISKQGFELFILNEFSLHMYSVASFMERKGIDTEPLNTEQISDAFIDLRETNRNLDFKLPS